jgi:hypothetical protein
VESKCRCKKLLEKDDHLLRVDINERSICHRLAAYLQEQFYDWNVDCEYNRNAADTGSLHAAKELGIPVDSVQSDDTDSITVFPDIIVHKRGTSNNLLVVEVKKTTNQALDGFDIGKLCRFKRQLHYSYALFLRFTTGQDNIGVRDEWIEERDCDNAEPEFKREIERRRRREAQRR